MYYSIYYNPGKTATVIPQAIYWYLPTYLPIAATYVTIGQSGHAIIH